MYSPILAETTATTMPSAIGTAVQYMADLTVTMISTVTSNAILCLGVAMWCIGGAIGLFKRLV